MTSTVFTVFLPVALGLVMFGLGLTLTADDFARVLKYPRAAAVALTCQLVLLPAICFGLVVAFGLEGARAVGMMLVVAAPGGVTAGGAGRAPVEQPLDRPDPGGAEGVVGQGERVQLTPLPPCRITAELLA